MHAVCRVTLGCIGWYRRALHQARLHSRGDKGVWTQWKSNSYKANTYRHTPKRKAAAKDANTHCYEVEDGSTIGTTKGSGETVGAEREVDEGDLEDRVKDRE